MIRLLALTAILLSLNCSLRAQYQLSDSLTPHNFWHSKTVRVGAIPTGLIAAGIFTWPARHEIREFRNRYIPEFKYHFDDYTQYLPVMAVIGLNAAGIKGRSTPGRAAVSYLFSAGVLAAVVNTVKYTTRVERPDGSSRNSFPSGHTANAFMNATFLHKEYGQYRHPLYSVGAYTVATVTALGRQLNDRHWISDVLAGAGIGILSTELGYMIADKIFDEHGLHPRYKPHDPIPVNAKPSFLEIRLAYADIIHHNLLADDKDVSAREGFNLGVEGAWFFTKNIGIGGEFSFSSFPMNADKLNMPDPDLDSASNGIYVQPMGVRNLLIGPYFSIPLRNNWFITAKLTIGSAVGAQGFVVMKLKPSYQEVFKRPELDVLRYKPESTCSWGTGVGLQKRISRNLGFKGFVNYYYSKHQFALDQIEKINDDGSVTYQNASIQKINFTHFTYGLGLTAFLW